MWQCKPWAIARCLVIHGKSSIFQQGTSLKCLLPQQIKWREKCPHFSLHFFSVIFSFPTAKNPSACTERCLFFQVNDTEGNKVGSQLLNEAWILSSWLCEVMANPLEIRHPTINTEIQTEHLTSQIKPLSVIKSSSVSASCTVLGYKSEMLLSSGYTE